MATATKPRKYSVAKTRPAGGKTKKARKPSWKEDIARLDAIIENEATSEGERENAKAQRARLVQKIEDWKNEKRAKETEVQDQVSEFLNSDDAWSTVVDMVTECGDLRRFSLGNLSMILGQAEARGTKPRALYTFKQWAALGRRVVKGSKAYALTMPVIETVTVTDLKTGETSEQERRSFRIVPKWFDIADTEPVGKAKNEKDGGKREPLALPASPLDTLISYIDRAGWTVDRAPAEEIGDVTTVDEAVETVTVANDIDSTNDRYEVLLGMLSALATRLAAQSWERMRAARAELDDAKEKKATGEAPTESKPQPTLFDMSAVWG